MSRCSAALAGGASAKAAAPLSIRTVHNAENEFCLILEGRVRLDGPDGTAEFRPGEAFVIEAGFLGTRETVEPVVKPYSIYEPPPQIP